MDRKKMWQRQILRQIGTDTQTKTDRPRQIIVALDISRWFVLYTLDENIQISLLALNF